MNPGRSIPGLFLLAALLGAAAPAGAEEIILKDGQKIVGTIVGYEKDMFRVETEYGIALVRKDKVASIQVAKPEAAKSETPQPKTTTTKSVAAKTDSEATPKSAPAVAPAAAAPPKTPATPQLPPPPPSPPQPPPPLPPPVSHPIDSPMPSPLRDHVEGSTYVNDTFQFSMFKPPGWKTYEGVPKETGSGITAMGTEDEQTLLIVDRQVWSGVPQLSSNQVEAKLRQTYQDYRRVSEESFTFDGQPAIRSTFTGIMDGAEWHGVAVYVIHGHMVFGIIGLTSADTFEFQQAIFNKIIRTFHFLAPAPPPSPTGPGNSTP